MANKVVVAGATGLVGNAALRHFGSVGAAELIALSRRKPGALHGARHVALDLTDAAQCAAVAGELEGVTHLIYAALYEEPNLVDGWRNPHQIETNDKMLRNLMAALEPASPALKHVALLQGTKAYGVHVRPLTVPAREGRSEMCEQPNFYRAQETFLRGLQKGKAWHWSILRPVLIVGLAMGGAMDLIRRSVSTLPSCANRAGRCSTTRRRRARGAGGRRGSARARHRLVGRDGGRAQRGFQRHQWRRAGLGERLAGDRGGAGHEAGQGGAAVAGEGVRELGRALERDTPQAQSDRAGVAGIRRAVVPVCRLQHRYGQTQPGPPSIVSTVKINRAGFTEMMDTEDMFRKWFGIARKQRLLP